MPVYVYKVLKTGELFEATQSMRDPAYTVHPTTGEPVKRIVQPVGIAFKGSGFYVNDNRARSNGHTGGNGAHKAHGSAAAASGGDAGSSAPAHGAAASGPASSGSANGGTASKAAGSAAD